MHHSNQPYICVTVTNNLIYISIFIYFISFHLRVNGVTWTRVEVLIINYVLIQERENEVN